MENPEESRLNCGGLCAPVFQRAPHRPWRHFFEVITVSHIIFYSLFVEHVEQMLWIEQGYSTSLRTTVLFM